MQVMNIKSFQAEPSRIKIGMKCRMLKLISPVRPFVRLCGSTFRFRGGVTQGEYERLRVQLRHLLTHSLRERSSLCTDNKKEERGS